MSLFDTIGLDIGYVVIAMAVVIIAFFICIIVLFSKNNKLQKRYDTFMQDSDGASLEKLFETKFSEVDGLVDKTNKIVKKMKQMDETLVTTYQKMGIVKYDAFDMGGKLSFALAMLNDTNDGFIINSMHSTREGCYTYAKEIVKGESFVILADEEKEALELAMNSKM